MTNGVSLMLPGAGVFSLLIYKYGLKGCFKHLVYARVWIPKARAHALNSREVDTGGGGAEWEVQTWLGDLEWAVPVSISCL